MKIAVISDLHGNLPDYHEDFKNVELLLICGDLVPLNIQANNYKSKRWFNERFNRWIDSLPIQKCFFIAGNHDFLAERSPDWMYTHFTKSSKATYLCNDSIDYTSKDGSVYKIFGTPYCHLFGNWPFMISDETLRKKFSEIPYNIDILISHDAPYGCCDICLESYWNQGEHLGNVPLREAILEKTPKYVFVGHLHSASKEIEQLSTSKITNCSVLNEQYKLVYPPKCLTLEK